MMAMGNNVIKFMDNFGYNSIADACVLWLMRKNRLYFWPYSPNVVRFLLLEFCTQKLSDKEVINRLSLSYPDLLSHQQIVNLLWRIYGITSLDKYEHLELWDIEGIRKALQNDQQELYIENNCGKKVLGKYWKAFYNVILPLVIEANGKVFEEQLDLEPLIKSISDNLNELNTQQLKEEYLENIFKDYRNSLLNRIFTLMNPQEMQKYIDGYLGKMSSLSGLTALEELRKSKRLFHLIMRYGNFDVYERHIGREQQMTNKLLCMMTTTPPTVTNLTPSEMVISQLGGFANSLAQFGDALNVLLANNGIIFSELKEKLGINVDINVSVTIQNDNALIPQANQIRQDNTMPILSSDGCLHLPIILDTPKARTVFMKAIDKGLIIPSADGKLSWTGLYPRSKNAELAYLCEIIYEGNYDVRGNHGKCIPFKELEELFGVKKLSTSIQQVHDAKRVQPWRAAIEELCK